MSISDITLLLPCDDYVCWKYYSDEPLFDKMAEKWNRIFDNIGNQKEFDFLLMSSNGVCLVAYDSSNLPFGFVFLYETDKGNLQIHGGNWDHAGLLCYHALAILLNTLVNHKFNVRTFNRKDNSIAYRLMNSLGFQRSHTIGDVNYMWLRESVFRKSKTINRFLQIQNNHIRQQNNYHE